jgi:hypothetical protein
MAEKVKTIRCPKCRGRMTLEGFEIEEHADGTWSCDPSAECPWDCGAIFFVTHSRVEWVKRG